MYKVPGHWTFTSHSAFVRAPSALTYIGLEMGGSAGRQIYRIVLFIFAKVLKP